MTRAHSTTILWETVVSCVKMFLVNTRATIREKNSVQVTGMEQTDSCRANYFGPTCSNYCTDTAAYSCSAEGERQCAANYYPDRICNVSCVPDTRKYTCKQTSGDKVCYDTSKRPEKNCEAEEEAKPVIEIVVIGSAICIFCVLVYLLLLEGKFIGKNKVVPRQVAIFSTNVEKIHIVDI